MNKGRLVCGWGINDVDYEVTKYEKLLTADGKIKRKLVWRCPYYTDWKSIIERCFSKKYQIKQPTYKGCTIDPDWKYLSNFIKWVDSQPNRNWQNCIPDKDFLSEGNKHYGQDTVVYISRELNSFITNSKAIRGDLPIGAKYCSTASSRKDVKYEAACSNPFTGKQEFLGVFNTAIEAHLAWKDYKHSIACIYANNQSDLRISEKLRTMYAPSTDLLDI